MYARKILRVCKAEQALCWAGLGTLLGERVPELRDAEQVLCCAVLGTLLRAPHSAALLAQLTSKVSKPTLSVLKVWNKQKHNLGLEVIANYQGLDSVLRE